MAKKEVKTNAMRILDREKIIYSHQGYEADGFIDGVHVADKLGLSHELVYKTLVTQTKGREYFTFVIPIEEELDLKKAAKAVGEKALEMLPLKDLTKVTGYVRGGTTSIGMKKNFPVIIQEDAKKLEHIYVSGGRVGTQIKLSPIDLQKVTKGEFKEVVIDHD
ncbi:Cys-tRNA(Pro)/Cys-tRNA(Cys) deacylase [Aequitasia blattaphilus]|uniref:Cys-tRNA(Pro)/Cys-tRNA(Cys) deacylase n=1 Tax=Aequitasia blattaphilus TaxID=2949332 RepID=A0ABT1E986_9FIRM|nr:Cys-tRNA(Pro) deacylase [Aequitasia blattaphilus]MCP1101077.1 Cys-tRNA(Pro) deacylase [Aequitasia blattaphilus]MCR8613717.1 Cys-tRNA(Pro) deacylase [Aequitasia blattaphilus]